MIDLSQRPQYTPIELTVPMSQDADPGAGIREKLRLPRASNDLIWRPCRGIA